MIAANQDAHAAPLVEATGVNVDAPGGRPLIRNLHLRLSRERVAVIGRNGAGKTSLLEVIAGRREPSRGRVVRRTSTRLVEQVLLPLEPANLWRSSLGAAGLSAATLDRELAVAGLPPSLELWSGGASLGELRKLHLLAAKLARPGVLLLDEPTQDLDELGAAWLARWLEAWPGCLIVVSHDDRLLRSFRQFFLIGESGCRGFEGSHEELVRWLEQDNEQQLRRYARTLNVLTERERHNLTVCRRRERKKNVGRLRELARATPRVRLNMKRGYAQFSQGRAAKIREDRIGTARSWARSSRRPLEVNLALDVPTPALPNDDGKALIELASVAASVKGRRLFEGLDLQLRRERLAVMGPNGAGKTTLLRVMLGDVLPDAGKARARLERIGVIAQGASDWMTEETLLARLAQVVDAPPEALAALLLAHRFPPALAERPLRTLSPGERVRAALICLFLRSPPVEMLVVDEPTDGLDFVGDASLRRVLAAWPGGLVVVSHDADFVASIGVDQRVLLDGRGGHRVIREPRVDDDGEC